MEIYVMVTSSVYDAENSVDCEVFKTKKEAKKAFYEQVKSVKEEMKEVYGDIKKSTTKDSVTFYSEEDYAEQMSVFLLEREMAE